MRMRFGSVAKLALVNIFCFSSAALAQVSAGSSGPIQQMPAGGKSGTIRQLPRATPPPAPSAPAPGSQVAEPVPPSAQPPVEAEPLTEEPAPQPGRRRVVRTIEEYEVPDKTWRFGAFGAANFGGQLSFNRATVSTSTSFTDSAEVRYDSDSTFSGGLEVAYVGPHAWGINAGIGLDTTHKLGEVTVNANGQVGTGTVGNNTNVDVTFAYVNALYRWEQFYFPFGFNLSRVRISNPPVALENLRGGLGIQLGLGVFITETLAAEILVRGIGVTAERKVVGATTIDFASGSLTTIGLVLKGYFF